MRPTGRTTQPYSFDDLDHRQFEDLARQLERREKVRWVFDTLHHLPLRAGSCLWTLPGQRRDRLMHRFGGEAGASAPLAHLLGANDAEWIAKLLDDKVVKPDQVLSALAQHDDSEKARVGRVMRLAAVPMAHGVQPARLARTTMFGSWRGGEASRFEKLRAAFESLEADRNQEHIEVTVGRAPRSEEEPGRATDPDAPSGARLHEVVPLLARQRRTSGELW